MPPVSPCRSYPTMLGLVALLGAAALAQQAPVGKKYLLKDLEAGTGDVSVVELSSARKLAMSAKPQGVVGAIPRPFELWQNEREKYTETILAVGQDGPTLLRRVYGVARMQKKSPAGSLKTVSRSYQGKTVTIKRVGEKVVVTAAKGKLTAADLRQLKERFEAERNFSYFPDREVGPGDEWAVDEALLKKKYGAKQASLKARFVDVVPFQGRPCAHVTLRLKMDVGSGKNLLSWDLQGETHYALDLRRTLSTKLSGPLGIKGTGNSGGIPLDLGGRGTGAFSHTRKWLKVGGKAPAEPA